MSVYDVAGNLVTDGNVLTGYKVISASGWLKFLYTLSIDTTAAQNPDLKYINIGQVIGEFSSHVHVRADKIPCILITGDRELKYNGRYEGNAYPARMMKLVGHKETKLFEFDGYRHGMRGSGFPLVYKHIHRISEQFRKIGK